MPMVLADARMRVRVLTVAPTNPDAVTAAEANAGEKFECNILKSDFMLGATGEDTVADTVLCAEGNATTPGPTNYEGMISVIRFLTDAGLPVPAEDYVWDLTREKGSPLYFLTSEGPRHTEAFVAGQEYDLYSVVTGAPRKPSDRGGYIKRSVPLFVQRAWEHKAIAAGV